MRRNPLIGVVLIAIGIAAVLVWAPGPSEPLHQDKPLSFWLGEIGYNQQEMRREEARKAIRSIGTNAIPWLLADLRQDEPKWKRLLKEWITRQSFLNVKYRSADARSSEAAWAFKALGPSGRSAIPELVQLLDRNPGYVPAALSGIGTDAVPALVAALAHTNRFVRSNAGGALANAIAAGEIPPSAAAAAVPLWLEQLKDSDANLRYYAAWGLGTVREQAPLCVQALMQSLDDPVVSVQSASAKSLQDFGPAAVEALPKLTNLLSAADSSVRHSVAGALGAIGDSRAVPALASATQDANDTVRIWVVGALGDIRKEPQISVPALMGALNDRNEMVRLKAAEGLAHFGLAARDAVEPLRKVAEQDSSERVRGFATQTLRRIEQAVGVLE